MCWSPMKGSRDGDPRKSSQDTAEVSGESSGLATLQQQGSVNDDGEAQYDGSFGA